MTTAVRSPVTDYAEDVLAGNIVVGKWLRLAAERHMRDLATGAARGLWFDDEAAEDGIAFVETCPHSKGEWAGQKVSLQPWQKFVIGSVFGWMREDGTRRFRKAYIELARKNGKSFLASAVGLKLAFFDNEPGAEVYAAATKRDQAKIVWGEARQMVRASPGLKSRITTLVANLHRQDTNSKFEPLGADEDSMDGLNIHGVIIDELHAHKNRKTYDVLNTAMGARRQPLMFIITTAGYDRESICWQEHDYGTKVLEGVIEDDTFFVFIAALDDDDDWTDISVWPKANPNWGVSVKPDTIIAAVEKAKHVPGEQNAILRLHGDVWTQQANRWIDMVEYDACDIPLDDLRGRACFAGIDLSSTRDISALELWFPPESEGEPVQVLSFFWVPEQGIAHRSRVDRVPYEQWAREGYIKPTSGNVVDYDVIRADVVELGMQYDIREIAFDRWNSTQLQTQLGGDGFTITPFGQGFASMTAPTKEIERLILERGIAFGKNPVLRWMFSNISVEQDAAGNLKMSKKVSREKIDGPVALAMAGGTALIMEPKSPSVYEGRGVLTV